MALPLAACAATVPPTVTRAPQTALGEPTIFLDAPAQRERIERSLTEAGFQVVSDYTAAYTLRVGIGDNRLTDVCGQKHNVSYSLAVHGSNVMVIKARGWTGSCEPNMFDEMSAKLAESFALAPAGEAVPPAVAAPAPSD